MAASPIPAPRRWLAYDVPLVGIPTRFESNAPEVIALARDALGAWHTGTARAAPADVPVVVRVEVEDDAPVVPVRPVSLVHRVEHRRLTITGPGVDAVSDAATRRATARVSRSVVADAEHFRYGVLESLALFIVSYLDRQPLHAAGIARDRAVVLLVGPAGVGKSTLTYAAMRAGYRVFAEDIVWLQLLPERRVWGLSRRIHLPAHAGRHFPELLDRPTTLVAAGEPKIVVPVEDHQRLPTPVAAAAGVCLVRPPGTGAASARPVDARTVRAALAPTEPGFLLFADTIGPALDALAAPGGWRLTPSPRPEEAVPLLDAMLTAVAARSG